MRDPNHGENEGATSKGESVRQRKVGLIGVQKIFLTPIMADRRTPRLLPPPTLPRVPTPNLQSLPSIKRPEMLPRLLFPPLTPMSLSAICT